MRVPPAESMFRDVSGKPGAPEKKDQKSFIKTRKGKNFEVFSDMIKYATEATSRNRAGNENGREPLLACTSSEKVRAPAARRIVDVTSRYKLTGFSGTWHISTDVPWVGNHYRCAAKEERSTFEVHYSLFIVNYVC